MMENQKKFENEEVVDESNIAEVCNDDCEVKDNELLSENSDNADACMDKEEAPKKAKKKVGFKEMSKKKKIAIISSITAAAVILITILTVVLVAFTGAKPAGSIDDSVLKLERNDKVFYLGKEGDVAAYGGNTMIMEFALPGATDFNVDASKATIETRKLVDKDVKVLFPKVKEGSFELNFKNADGKKDSLTIKIIDGYNVYDFDELEAVISNQPVIVIQNDITTMTNKYMLLNKTTVYGNAFTLDATSLSSKAQSSVFNIDGPDANVTIKDWHIIGEKLEKDKADDNKEISLDEFEGNGELFRVRGSRDSANKEIYPRLTIEHSLLENGHKLVWMANSEVTIKNSVLRNASDAIIAVETNAERGAVLNTENTILSNSVVAGILFCGWTNVSGKEDFVRSTLNVKGYLDIYNWKDTRTTKLVPATEGAVATLVNKMVASELKKLIKDENAVKEYMVKDGDDYYVHMGVIRLATGSFAKNESTLNGVEQVGFKLRKFPIPEFANAIAKTCDLVSYTQESASSKTAVKPGDKLTDSSHLVELGFRVVA